MAGGDGETRHSHVTLVGSQRLLLLSMTLWPRTLADQDRTGESKEEPFAETEGGSER